MQAVMDAPVKARSEDTILTEDVQEIEIASPEDPASEDFPNDLDALLDFSVEIKRGAPTPLLDGDSCCCSCCSCKNNTSPK